MATQTSHSSKVTSNLDTAKAGAIVTVCCGLSVDFRPGSSSGDPIGNIPAGTTTLSGQPEHSVKESFGCSARSAIDPVPCQLVESCVFLEPGDVGVQRVRKLVGAQVERGVVGEKDDVDPGNFRRDRRKIDLANDDRSQALPVQTHLFDLPVDNLGGERSRADDEYDRVALLDKMQQLAFPVLQLGEIAAVDLHLEAARLQRAYQAVDKPHIAPRIRDE